MKRETFVYVADDEALEGYLIFLPRYFGRHGVRDITVATDAGSSWLAVSVDEFTGERSFRAELVAVAAEFGVTLNPGPSVP